jgi:hypothetical protein
MIADLRKYLKIVEGELIPQPKHILRINTDAYGLMRAIMHLSAPEKFTSPNHYGEVGILSFHDSVAYLDAKNKLTDFGVKFDEEPHGMTDYWDTECTPETEHTASPYPSNNKIQQHFDDTSPPVVRKLRDRHRSVVDHPPYQRAPKRGDVQEAGLPPRKKRS